jgi:hypothetical protein
VPKYAVIPVPPKRRSAEETESEVRRRAGRELRRREEARVADEDVVLPPEHRLDEIALREVGTPALHDLADADRPHRLAERDHRDVGVHRHPAALRRIEGEPERLDEHLAVARPRDLALA